METISSSNADISRDGSARQQVGPMQQRRVLPDSGDSDRHSQDSDASPWSCFQVAVTVRRA